MRKGQQTRAMIVEQAARLFSLRGYHGASVSELLKETGLEKGGLYNHFGSKDALALEAFDYSVGLVESRFRAALEGRTDPLDKLLAIVGAFASLVGDPPLPGGCPVLTTSIEADDTHPALLERARDAMTAWHRLLGSIVKDGAAAGRFRAGVDPRAVASVVTGSLEGAVMLSKLYSDPSHMRHAVRYLTAYLRSLSVEGRKP